ncbi:hypothetical protein AOL_s00215g20 [Orbilia oligospora ATCC 24927]|uniref:Uncharacterized protein n=1 Tax=Arthrobotrys oligospora (strain ATCC 24927 / CBS 115.81 / DSM 1491) TaxID=756982 RepID=G1XT91_ARTOA|nr:hypothetical protein AOL_s00215g20 [Orbilia oligospora ATCC 24927]EGX43284.1 hypothetical protein AOL_s00215g20 [Orbilia oligospora ATCC 24927]
MSNIILALRATQTPTRLAQASADCTRIIDVTYTPPTVTKTEYSTVTVTDISTIPSTLVETFFDTQTDVIQATATTDLLTTITKPANKKRVVTSSSISFPAYATPCSGFYRFSSACSCIGVTPRIITASAPSTTVTLQVTETSLTEVTKVVETTSVTITDATVSVTTTDKIVINTIATTVEAPPTEITQIGRIYVNNAARDSYIGEKVLSSNVPYAYYTNNVNEAIPLRLDSNGHLWTGGRVAKGNPTNSGAGSLLFSFVDPDVSTDTREPFFCTKDAESFIICTVGPQTPPVPLSFTWRTSGFIYISSYENANTNNYVIIKFKLQ